MSTIGLRMLLVTAAGLLRFSPAIFSLSPDSPPFLFLPGQDSHLEIKKDSHLPHRKNTSYMTLLRVAIAMQDHVLSC